MGRRRATSVASIVVTIGGLLLPAGAAHAAPAVPVGAEHHRGLERVGYYTNWASAEPRNFLVRNLVANGQARRLTVLNYAFANVSADGRCFTNNVPGEGDANADYQRSFTAEQSVDGRADRPGQALAGNFNQLRKLKKRYPGLRTQISIGGWTFSRYISNAALDETSRRAFVASCIDLFIKGNLPRLAGDPHGGRGAGAGVFDGIDIDWEWPGSPGAEGNVVRPEDKRNFTLMLAEFRRQLDVYGRRTHHHYSLTAFLPADPAQMDNGYEVPKVFRLLDFATVQGYDMHGSWENTTNHQSALFAPEGEPQQPDFTVDRAIAGWIERGAPRSKLIMGVPFYGRGWTGVPNVNRGLFQPATGAAPGSNEEGYEDYRNLVTLLGKGFKLYRDERAGFAWLFDGTTFWTYDDPVVVGWKARYIKRNRLGGAMVWSLDADDGDGTLMRTLDRGLRR